MNAATLERPRAFVNVGNHGIDKPAPHVDGKTAEVYLSEAGVTVTKGTTAVMGGTPIPLDTVVPEGSTLTTVEMSPNG